MICPLDVMSQFIALQGDENTEIRNESLRLIQVEDERHSTFLDNRILEGIELTYKFQIKVLGSVHPFEDGIFIENFYNENFIKEKDKDKDRNEREKVSIFSLLYSSCIQSNKKRRNEFLIGLLKRAYHITQMIRNNNCDNNDKDNNNDNNNNNNNNNNNINKNYINNDKSPTISQKSKLKINENGIKSPRKLKENLTVSEAIHLYSLLSFILSTISHLPFDLADEALQVTLIKFYYSICNYYYFYYYYYYYYHYYCYYYYYFYYFYYHYYYYYYH